MSIQFLPASLKLKILSRDSDMKIPENIFDPKHYSDVRLPVMQANLLPPWCYTSQEFYEREVQEIFMKIFSKINQYAGKKPFNHWASKIAVNTCYDRLRKKKIRPELIYGERAVQTAIKPKLSYSRRLKATENELIDELIQELLSTLNEQERTVVRLTELKEKTVKEVCELTGWSESKVKVTKMRARKKLQSAMINLEKNPLKPLNSVGISN